MFAFTKLRRALWKLTGAGVAPFFLGGCLLPPAANVQDARIVGDRGVRVTAHWSGLHASGDGGGEKLGDEFGVLLGVGVGDATELQLRVERLEPSGGEDGYQFLSFGPKFGLMKDRLALLIPSGVYLGGGIEPLETFQIQPAFLETVLLSPQFELNASQRLILPFNPDLFTWLNLGFGVGLSTDLDRWAILPEISYSISLDGQEPILSYGVALVMFSGQSGAPR
jgi:hypothetical protein